MSASMAYQCSWLISYHPSAGVSMVAWLNVFNESLRDQAQQRGFPAHAMTLLYLLRHLIPPYAERAQHTTPGLQRTGSRRV